MELPGRIGCTFSTLETPPEITRAPNSNENTTNSFASARRKGLGKDAGVEKTKAATCE